VVKTKSFSIKDIELPPFILIFMYLKAKYMPRGGLQIQFHNCLTFKINLDPGERLKIQLRFFQNDILAKL